MELVRLAPAAHGSEPTRGKSSEIRDKPQDEKGKAPLRAMYYYVHHKTCVWRQMQKERPGIEGSLADFILSANYVGSWTDGQR